MNSDDDFDSRVSLFLERQRRRGVELLTSEAMAAVLAGKDLERSEDDFDRRVDALLRRNPQMLRSQAMSAVLRAEDR